MRSTITRFVILAHITVLALPITILSQPAETGPSPWAEIAVAAKGKTHKKTDKHSRFTTVTRTVRQPVTRTFSNQDAIVVPGGGPGSTLGNANLYPSAINVNGFANGVITDVNLTLHNFTHTAPVDVDVLLVPAQLPGQDAIVMSDVGNEHDAANVTLTLDDQAATPLSENDPLVTGTFQPNNVAGSSDNFPGQTPSGNTWLSLFNGGNPNGWWQLFVVDDHPSDTDIGQFAGGWSLQITAVTDVQVQERIPTTRDANHGARHNHGKRSKQ